MWTMFSSMYRLCKHLIMYLFYPGGAGIWLHNTSCLKNIVPQLYPINGPGIIFSFLAPRVECNLRTNIFQTACISPFISHHTTSYTTASNQFLWYTYTSAHTWHLHMGNVNQYYVFVMLHITPTCVNYYWRGKLLHKQNTIVSYPHPHNKCCVGERNKVPQRRIMH